MPADPPVAELLRHSLAGDAAAFTSLLLAHDDRMRALAYRMLGSRAAMDDALQDAYLKAYRSLGSYRGEASFATWLHRIVRNTCVDHLRREHRRKEVPLELIVSNPDQSGSPDDRAVGRSDMRTALAALPADQRAIVVLVDGDGMSYQEVASLLHTNPGTVASRLSRARTTLRAALGADPREGTR